MKNHVTTENFFRAALPLIPIRKEPKHTSEMVDQLLYGDLFTIIEKHQNWLLIETVDYIYRGYIDAAQTLIEPIEEPNSLVFLNPTYIKLTNHEIWLPIGAQVSNKLRLSAPVITFDESNDPQIMNETIKRFLGTPYLWGGKTCAGTDCSGMVQTIFRFSNHFLPRDAYQQATFGTTIHFAEEAKPFDLAFFKNNDGQIIHVGIILGQGNIVHASAWVRTDKFDNFGIFNESQNKYTHTLSVIKRIL